MPSAISPEPIWKLIGRSMLDRHFPKRIPMRVAQQRLTVVLRLSGEENAFVAHSGAAAYLLHCRLDVPERNRGDGQQAARVGGRPFGLPIVIDLHAGEHQLGIIQLQKLLRAKAANVRIHDHRPDSHLVHVLQARVGVVCSRMHLFVVFGRMLETSHSGGGGQPDIRQGPSRSHQPALSPIASRSRHAARGRASGQARGWSTGQAFRSRGYRRR